VKKWLEAMRTARSTEEQEEQMVTTIRTDCERASMVTA
jgi:hypothetical protein